MYIRTKDWIYDTENLHYRWIENNKVYKVGWDVEKPTFEADIIDQSENLEELCDMFILIENADGQKIHSINYTLCDDLRNNKDNEGIYGAIWTDKGLIYVAKLVNKWKLMLI